MSSSEIAPARAVPVRPSRQLRRLAERYGPVAVVTGASSGIGRAAAERIAAAGLDLVVVSRGADALADLARGLGETHGVTVTPLALDLSTTTGVEEMAGATAGLDVGLLVASAGFGTSGRFLESPLDEELEMLAVNGAAVVAQCHHFGRRFAARGRGGIVLLSSIVGFQGLPNAAHYAATKAYVQTLADGLHLELRPQGVDVLAVAPGPTATGFAARSDLRMGGAASPERVAAAALASLGRRSTVFPGLRSVGLRSAVAPLPRRIRSTIMGKVMGGMTAHQRTG